MRIWRGYSGYKLYKLYTYKQFEPFSPFKLVKTDQSCYHAMVSETMRNQTKLDFHMFTLYFFQKILSGVILKTKHFQRPNRFRSTLFFSFSNIKIAIVHKPKLSAGAKGYILLYSSHTKLDQETWLCRTHLDDFLVKIWTTLDHTRARLNLVIKGHHIEFIVNFQTIKDH